MLKGQDVVVLLKLLGPTEALPVRKLADDIGFDVAGTHRALRRLDEAGLYSAKRRRVNRALAEEFLIHAVKFIYPARLGPEVRGIPTSWGAEPLKRHLADSEGLIPVWPFARGDMRGLSLEPIHPIVPEAALADPALWKRLTLVDALRSHEGTRVSGLAEQLLREGIGL